MGALEGKVFKSGDGVAVQLPAEFGFVSGTSIDVAKDGGGIRVRSVDRLPGDVGDARENNRRLAEELAAIWADFDGPPEQEIRDPDIFPDRPGLY